MSGTFLILTGIATLCVAASLFMGLFAMARGNPQASNKMMRARVILQGIAVLMFICAVLVSKS